MSAWYACRYGGILQHSGPVPLRPHDPEVPLWFGSLVPWGSRRGTLAIGGAGWDRASAEAAAVGEAIERLQPYPLSRDHGITASFADWPADESAVEPERWVLFHPEQYAQAGFPYRPLTRDTVCRWLCFREALSGRPCWVPEELAFLYPRPGTRHELGPGISTGLSCGRIGQPVLLRGLQEVIERDAVVGAWWDRYPLEEWDGRMVLAMLGPALTERLQRPNLRYRWYRVGTPFSAHVTVATLEGEDHEGFCFSAGAACRETRRDSWLKSALEAVQGRHYARYLRRTHTLAIGERPGELLDFVDHALYYSLHPEQLPATVFHRAEKPMSTADAEISEDCSALVARLGPEHPVLCRTVTPPGIAREIGDWYVLKVLVPGLQPLHGNDRYPHLGGPLWAPRQLADWPRVPPHPFP